MNRKGSSLICTFLAATLIVFATPVPRAAAQDVVALTLDSAIQKAQTESPLSRIARYRLDSAHWNYRSFTSDFKPTLALTASAPGLERSISDIQQDDGSVRYVEQSRTLARAGISLSQNLPFTGGTLSLSSGLSRINQFGDFDFSQWQTSALVVGLSQPILRFNQQKWDRRVRPVQLRLDEQRFEEEMSGIAVEISNLFFDVVIAQIDLETAEFNIAVNDTIYALSQGRYEIGSIAENDLLQSELALLNAQSSKSASEVALEQALQNLKTALGLDLSTELIISPPQDIPSDEVDPNVAVQEAGRNQSAIRSFELESITARRDLDQARKSNGLGANLSAEFGYNQSADAFDQAYTDLLNSQRLSVNLTVPIVQWGRGKAEVQQALADIQRIEEDQRLRRQELEQEAYFTAVQFNQLREQVAIAGKADTVATRRFEVARNRYLIGRIDVTDLFDAQVEKDNASASYIRTLRDCWTAYYRLRQLTLFDFERKAHVVFPMN